jgi:hypothetical protein
MGLYSYHKTPRHHGRHDRVWRPSELARPLPLVPGISHPWSLTLLQSKAGSKPINVECVEPGLLIGIVSTRPKAAEDLQEVGTSTPQAALADAGNIMMFNTACGVISASHAYWTLVGFLLQPEDEGQGAKYRTSQFYGRSQQPAYVLGECKR